MPEPRPVVTVCLFTYNHAPYIAEAIEGVLMQEADFPFELLIGEDDSTDGTREIVLDYRSRHPDRIRVLLNDRSDVVYVDGKPTGRWNYANTLSQARGTYVAMIDGDDYWTDPRKLQLQADLLRENSDLALCCTAFAYVYQDDPERPSRIKRPNAPRPRYTRHDLLRGDHIGPPAVVMFVRERLGPLPDWIYTLPNSDIAIYYLIARRGDVGYIDAVTAHYRLHGASYYGGRSDLQRAEMSLLSRERMLPHMPKSDRKALKQSMYKWYARASEAAGAEGIPGAERAHSRAALRHLPYAPSPSIREMLTLVRRSLTGTQVGRMADRVGLRLPIITK